MSIKPFTDADAANYCMSLDVCRANDGHTDECEAWWATKQHVNYIVCPACGYEREAGGHCGLPCV